MDAPQLPEVGSRVSLRYLPGSQPPMGDVVGHLLDTGPRVRVRARDGALHEFRRSDVLYVRRLTDRPVKNSAIRSVEYAAALAWPGTSHEWHDGWLLRAGHGATLRANSAVPLDRFAHPRTIAAIVDWYAARGQTPWLAVPERLLRLPEIPARCEIRTLVAEPAVTAGHHEPVTLSGAPDAAWLAVYAREVPAEVLSAVTGEVRFAAIPGVAVGRGALTRDPDGQWWLGLSALRVAPDRRRRHHATTVCAALLAWGAARGAARAYAQVRSDDPAAFGLFTSLGFTAQHRSRYVDARLLSS